MSEVIDLALNPYLGLGLQRNPFIGEEQFDRSELIWIDRGWSQAPSTQTKQLVQVMGDKGFGKTSHLKHWQSQTGGPYCYVPPGWKRFKIPAVKQIAYWDEADRIPIPLLIIALTWASFTSATIVMGTHSERGKIAARLGFTVTTIDLPPLDVETLLIWANDRIKSVSLRSQTGHLLLQPEKAEEIIAIAQGSWRTAADYLHIWVAEVANQLERIESQSRHYPLDH